MDDGGEEVEDENTGHIVVKLPMPPGSLTTLYDNDARYATLVAENENSHWVALTAARVAYCSTKRSGAAKPDLPGYAVRASGSEGFKCPIL